MSVSLGQQHSKGLVSVVIPCYNYARFLKETVQSVIDQTYTQWECIIVDDGSTDDTKQVAAELCGKDTRIVYIHQHNQGLSSARNTGIKAARGEYIQLLDSDDLIAPEKFHDQVKCFEADEGTDMVYSDYHLMNADGSETWSVSSTNWIEMRHAPFNEFLHYWEKGFTIPIHCYLFKRMCFERWGSFDTTLPTHEDLALQLNFSLFGARYHMLSKVSSFYRVHGASMAKDHTKMHLGYLICLRRCLSHPKATLPIKAGIIHRYFQEVFNTVLDSVRGRKNALFKALNFSNAPVLSVIGLILIPVYLIHKIISKVI